MRIFLSTLFLFWQMTGTAQDTLHFMKVHFLYGSKPAKGYKKTEAKWFGGIHGGHVSIELDSLEIGFAPAGGFHIFAHKHHLEGKFFTEPIDNWKEDTIGRKYLSITIPLSGAEYLLLQKVHQAYLQHTPYDYAFIGMRCASATYDVLSRAGFFPVYSNTQNIYRHFYPKPLRKKMIRWAEQKGYAMFFHEGVKSRKWEKD